MTYLKKGLKAIGWFVLITLLYVILSILHGTVTDYQPTGAEAITVEEDAASELLTDSTADFLIWNIGYGGLGKEANFFYDNGKMVFAGGDQVNASADEVKKNIDGFVKTIQSIDADFYLLQEVDVKSKRGQGINEYETGLQAKQGYEGTFAMNYNVKRVPLPVLEPWNVIGKVQSGLATYSKYQLDEPTRHQLPGKYEWPTRIFQLDRCMATHRVDLKNGKELLVINIHNSAYDKGGLLKKQQMEFIRDFVVSEYEKGNYVVVGGDWNQCPPGFDYKKFRPTLSEDYFQYNIAADLYPKDWIWAHDPAVPTNRKLSTPYEGEKSFVTLIDFFLVSPNLEIEEVKGIDLAFEYSDHQPVYLKVGFKD